MQRPLTLVPPTLSTPYFNDKLIVYVVEYPPWTALKPSAADIITPIPFGTKPKPNLTPGMPFVTTLTTKEGLMALEPIPQHIQNSYPNARIRAFNFFQFGGNPAVPGSATATINACAKCPGAGESTASVTFCFAWNAQAQPVTSPPTQPTICNTCVQPFKFTNLAHCGMSFGFITSYFGTPSTPPKPLIAVEPSYVVLELAQDCTAPGVDLLTLCDGAPSATISCDGDCDPCVAGSTYIKTYNDAFTAYAYTKTRYTEPPIEVKSCEVTHKVFAACSQVVADDGTIIS